MEPGYCRALQKRRWPPWW